ncbi:hypothetical protein CCYA_CCYA19G4748 [Cyanidiococcus yangmingshanensis]|nr:hypothetical protein CCYA_CCYA19G4748 [Cyanidiococcus yangmingshanensis]
MSSSNSVLELTEFILQFLQGRASAGTTQPAVRQSELVAEIRLHRRETSTLGAETELTSTSGASESAQTLDQHIAEALNTLLKAGDIQLVRQQRHRGELMIQLANAQRKRLAGLSNTERAVYEQVRVAGEYGVWVRHIRGRLGLPLSDVNRALKELQRRELVKQVQNVRNKTRKLYMLAELEPSREVTGGPFYDDEGTFDHEFIHQLRELIWRRLMQVPWTSANELTKFLNQSNVLRFTLEPSDLEMVLQTMCWDLMLCRATDTSAQVRQVRNARGLEQHKTRNSRVPHGSSKTADGMDSNTEFYYACVRGRDGLASIPDAFVPPERLGFGSALSQVPCTKCPVREKCSRLNPVVNARICPYLEAWTRSMCS